MNESVPNLLRRAIAIQRAGGRITMCLLVRARGSTPASAGALMLIDDAANTFGTIGGGCIEAEVRRRAHMLAASGRSALLRFKLDHDYGWDDGLICGGTLEMAIAPAPASAELARVLADIEARQGAALRFRVDHRPDPLIDDLAPDPVPEGPVDFLLRLPPAPSLYIAGAGHVGQALARQALNLEFNVTVFDDRPDLLERFVPAGAARVSGDIADHLAGAPIDAGTYIVIVTRGHRHDEQALAAVLARGAKYTGMIGSRRKVKLIFDDLAAAGHSRDELARVYAPIGVRINSVTVEEIAVSIAAQLIQVRRSTATLAVEGPIPVPPAPDEAGAAPGRRQAAGRVYGPRSLAKEPHGSRVTG